MKKRTYPVWTIVCGDCKRTVTRMSSLGEYPWSWQFVVCHYCGGHAVPTDDPKQIKYPFPPVPSEEVEA